MSVSAPTMGVVCDIKGGLVDRSLSVLVGNGLSIAYNPGLRLDAITKHFLQNLESESFDGSEVVNAMRKVARHAFPDGPDEQHDFELLVGAFENSSLYFKELSILAENMDSDAESTLAALDRLALFAQTVRNSATSRILEVIMQNSRARRSEENVISNFADAICGSFNGKITFGNLNYDSLLAAALVDRYQGELTDMADGRQGARIKVSNSKSTGEASRLRESESDFQDSRLLLLHLHGSLTFWAGEKYRVKIPVSLLTDLDQWSSIRTGKARAYPLVALTGPSEKSNTVEKFPFNLAYRMFRASLQTSDKWLIAGYSFRDRSVNKMLSEEFWRGAARPKILVIDKDNSLLLTTIYEAFDWNVVEHGDPSAWLSICRSGMEEFRSSKVWSTFVSS